MEPGKVAEQTEVEVVVVPHEKQAEVDNMKRQLTEDELEKTNKGIERLDKEIVDFKEQIEFNEKTIEFSKVQAEYNNVARPYLKKKKEAEDKNTMKRMYQDLKFKEATVKELHSHVTEGVTVKENAPADEEVK